MNLKYMKFLALSVFIFTGAANATLITLESRAITENISAPRYAEVEDDKLYITNSGSKSITIYNIQDFTYNSTIEIEKTVEQIIIEDDYFLFTSYPLLTFFIFICKRDLKLSAYKQININICS